jgi:hypothetical protein
LETVAKRFPERFGRLALRFPPDVHPSYKAAIIEGLKQKEPTSVPEAEKAAWRPAPVDLIDEILAAFGPRECSEYAQRFCWMMHDRADERWSTSALAQLAELATTHEDPAPTELSTRTESGGFDVEYASVANLEQHALNCVRGVASLAIGQLLWNHSDLLDDFRSVIYRLCEDSHQVVRIAALDSLTPVLNIDRGFAIDGFCLAASDDLRVAASRRGVYFFNCGMQSHHQQLSELIRQMLDSDDADIACEGASEVCARWVFNGDFEVELERCLHGAVPQRKGLALVASSLVQKDECFEKCSRVIKVLWDDPDPDVRASLWQSGHMEDLFRSQKGRELMRLFTQSIAFRDEPGHLVWSLSEYGGSLLPFADVLLSMADQFVGPLRDATRDISQGVTAGLSRFMPMLLRLYEQAEDEENVDVVTRCLDAFDLMFERRVGIVHEISRVLG